MKGVILEGASGAGDSQSHPVDFPDRIAAAHNLPTATFLDWNLVDWIVIDSLAGDRRVLERFFAPINANAVDRCFANHY